MGRKSEDLEDFGRFAEPSLLILISLAERPRHGYAITRDIEEVTGHRPGPGTLYGAIARLESRGFVCALDSAGDRKVTYELTAAGEKALRARLAAMASVTRIGQQRLAGA